LKGAFVRPLKAWLLFVVASTLCGCVEGGTQNLASDGADAGRPAVDAGRGPIGGDAGSTDDAGPTDGAGPFDAGADGGAHDAGQVDAGASDGGPDDGDAGTSDAGLSDAGTVDAGPSDAGSRDGGQFPNDGGILPPFDAGPPPRGELRPVRGELLVTQLDLESRIPPPAGMGESAIIVGPDGTLVLVDIGNAMHADEVRATVKDLNTNWLVPDRGYAAREALEVDWIVLTHHHNDHMGAFANLMTGPNALTLKHGVIHRGFTDLGKALSELEYKVLCDSLTSTLAAFDLGLCATSVKAPCDSANFTQTYPAENCDRLRVGSLSTPDDDAARAPSFIDLGDGARLTLVAANGWVNGTTELARPSAFGVTKNNEENARSVVALLNYGAFQYHLAGDLSGSGKAGEPDAESHLIRSGTPFYGPLGVDVVHANHHSRRTSSNATFVEHLAPTDGLSRNVVSGITSAYADSPHSEVLSAWLSANRLKDGRLFVTRRSPVGANDPLMITGDGRVVVRTMQEGAGYWIQAPTQQVIKAFPSVRRGQ
jgi:hypothetical protein